MKACYDEDFRIGLLGGGQLGRMLIQSALNFDVAVAVLDPDPQAPCAALGDPFVLGDWRDFDTVLRFGKDKDVVTVEIEHVSVAALKALEEQGVTVRPASSILEKLQDKGLQKAFYREAGFPTAPYVLVEDKAAIAELEGRFFPAVQKLRKGGYDGKGVCVLQGKADLSKAFDAPSVLEQYVPFEREVSTLVARNARGQSSIFPLVESRFNPEANLVEMLFSPAEVEAEIQGEAARLALSLAESLSLEGILAVEFFLTREGQLLINEVAPRPHNSGHHTIQANVTSQYEQHLRAVLDLPLGEARAYRAAAMVNLLGAMGERGVPVYENLESLLQQPDVHVHLYGKRQTKPYRKMGHFTVLGADAKEVVARAEELKNCVKIRVK